MTATSNLSAGADLPRNQIIVGDARAALKALPAESIDCIVTSPPYFRLRNYGHAGQIGLEETVDEWFDELRLVARGLRRVLKPTGSLWLNLGDTFSRQPVDGARPKSLVLAPERLALALTSDGWVLRNKVTWAKTNPMPTSVRDRLSCTWEVVYFLSREDHYFFDLDAIREPHTRHGESGRAARRQGSARAARRRPRQKAWSVPESWRRPSSGSNGGLDRLKAMGLSGHTLGKNPGDVWLLPTAAYRGAHHAVYPERLIEKPILATCPEKVCVGCGAPWLRPRQPPQADTGAASMPSPLAQQCDCTNAGTRPGIVLDPFMGSGTTAVVAEQHRRDWLGCESSTEIAGLAEQRITDSPRTLTNENKNHDHHVTGRGRTFGRRQRQQPAAVPGPVRVVLAAGHDPAQPVGDIGVGVEAEHGVGLGQRVGQFASVAFGEAADGHHGLRPPGPLVVGGRENRVDRVLLGGVDEAAGVDHDRARGVRIVGEFEAALL